MNLHCKDNWKGTSSHVAATVPRLREPLGLSVRTLAERSGFSASFISQVENGLAASAIDSLERVASALSVSLSEFFDTPGASPTLLTLERAGEGRSLHSDWSSAARRLNSLPRAWCRTWRFVDPPDHRSPRLVAHRTHHSQFEFVLTPSRHLGEDRIQPIRHCECRDLLSPRC